MTNEENEYRLEIYAGLDELEHNVPQELYEAVASVVQNNPTGGVEVLDI